MESRFPKFSNTDIKKRRIRPSIDEIPKGSRTSPFAHPRLRDTIEKGFGYETDIELSNSKHDSRRQRGRVRGRNGGKGRVYGLMRRSSRLLPIRGTCCCCFLIAIATFNLRPLRTRLSPSRRTRLASSSVSKVMKPYLRRQENSCQTQQRHKELAAQSAISCS